MRGLRLRAEKAETVGEHYTQIVKKKTVCGVTEIQIPTLCLTYLYNLYKQVFKKNMAT